MTPGDHVRAATPEFRQLIAQADWLNDEITQDFIRVVPDREKWRWLRDTASENLAIPHPYPYLSWMSRLYGNNVCIAVRRHVDQRGDSRGLRRFLESLRRTGVSRDTYVRYRLWLGEGSVFPEERQIEMAHDSFDKVVGGGVPRMRRRDLADDFNRLDEVAELVVDYTNTWIAHLGNREEDGSIPTFGDLDEVIDTLGEIIVRYHSFLRGTHLRITPVDHTEWTVAFAAPWFDNEGYVRRMHEKYPRIQEAK